MAVVICPPEHDHDKKTTCYRWHKCRCKPCRARRSRASREAEPSRKRAVILNGGEVNVSATGTLRRLRALAVMGWGVNALALITRLDNRNLGKIREGRSPTVTLSTARAVRDVYARLSATRNSSHAGAIARTRALNNGWHSPLAWHNIDNPNETPYEGVNDL